MAADLELLLQADDCELTPAPETRLALTDTPVITTDTVYKSPNEDEVSPLHQVVDSPDIPPEGETPPLMPIPLETVSLPNSYQPLQLSLLDTDSLLGQPPQTPSSVVGGDSTAKESSVLPVATKRPTFVLLLDNMFRHFSLQAATLMAGGRASDRTVGGAGCVPGEARRDYIAEDAYLETDEDQLASDYAAFYVDVSSELERQFGEIRVLRTCRNRARHLRGCVLVEFASIRAACIAARVCQYRWYAGQQLSARLTRLSGGWREAVCGLYHRNRCTKGDGSCNYLHVFLNPGETVSSLNEALRRNLGAMPSQKLLTSTVMPSRGSYCSTTLASNVVTTGTGLLGEPKASLLWQQVVASSLASVDSKLGLPLGESRACSTSGIWQRNSQSTVDSQLHDEVYLPRNRHELADYHRDDDLRGRIERRGQERRKSGWSTGAGGCEGTPRESVEDHEESRHRRRKRSRSSGKSKRRREHCRRSTEDEENRRVMERTNCSRKRSRSRSNGSAGRRLHDHGQLYINQDRRHERRKRSRTPGNNYRRQEHSRRSDEDEESRTAGRKMRSSRRSRSKDGHELGQIEEDCKMNDCGNRETGQFHREAGFKGLRVEQVERSGKNFGMSPSDALNVPSLQVSLDSSKQQMEPVGVEHCKKAHLSPPFDKEYLHFLSQEDCGSDSNDDRFDRQTKKKAKKVKKTKEKKKLKHEKKDHKRKKAFTDYAC